MLFSFNNFKIDLFNSSGKLSTTSFVVNSASYNAFVSASILNFNSSGLIILEYLLCKSFLRNGVFPILNFHNLHYKVLVLEEDDFLV